MVATPEWDVKKEIRKILDSFLPDIWYTMPVPCGFGQSTLDFIGSVPCRHIARSFAIEAKAPGKKPTPRQQLLIERLKGLNVPVFVIDGESGYNELRDWLTTIKDINACYRER